MNREIKFRAWDFGLREMIPVDDIQFRNNEVIENDGITLLPKDEQPVIINTKSCWRVVDGKDAVLMQFTGLLDKNGKEIYEGDIVEYDEVTKHEEHVTDRWIVEWVKQLGAYQLVNCRPDIQADFIYEVGESLLEVTGNIYENPDLLTTNT